MSTVILLAHPDYPASRANRALLSGLAGVEELDIADLYALYPSGDIDLAPERARLLGARRLIIQFPLQWYATPALLKVWEDTVLTPLIYLEPESALAMKGLPVLAATTTGGPAASYAPAGMTIDELFAPLRATANKCGWIWQPPFAVHDVRNLDAAALELESQAYRARILSTPKLD